MCFVVFFFFKQKEAFEMGIRDWRSDGGLSVRRGKKSGWAGPPRPGRACRAKRPRRRSVGLSPSERAGRRQRERQGRSSRACDCARNCPAHRLSRSETGFAWNAPDEKSRFQELASGIRREL